MVEKMSEMDPASMMNQMYYSAMRLLPIFILIIILSNSLIADQVDQGGNGFWRWTKYVFSLLQRLVCLALKICLTLVWVLQN